MKRNHGFKRILFAVNGSEHSKAAFPVVAAIATKSNAEVLVLHVWNPSDFRLEHDDDVSRRRNDETNITAVVERLSAAGVSAAGEAQEATSDTIAAFIGRRADSFDADLIALGNRGLSELHSFLIGSRTQQVLAHATLPVLAVRNVKPRRGSGIGRVALVLDESGDYASVVQACVDVAQAASAEVDVIHFENRNDRKLSAVAHRLARHGIMPAWRSAHGGNHAADEILSAALSARADLLIIGATHPRARSLLAPDVMGRVLQSCPCPLLVAPARNRTKAQRAAMAGAHSPMRALAV